MGVKHRHAGHAHHGESSPAGADHGHAHGAAPKRVLALALALTASFMLVEAAVGWWSGSLALLADAGHMLADAGALALALVAQQWASRSRTERSTFGYRRAEVLAAFVNGITISVAALWIVKEAVERWMLPIEIRGTSMLTTAFAGLLVNAVVAALLMRAQKESLNVRAAFAHVVMDAMGSVAAIVAGLAVVFFGVRRADPALSVLIAALVAYSGWRLLKETTTILLEGAPPNLDVAKIERAILDCPGVAGLHDLHVWRISDSFDALTVHVTLERGAHGTDVCKAVCQRLHDDFGLDHVTVQPEAPLPDELVNVRLSRDGAPIRRVS
jgi:cobalt-zinc-cadmium efflux system protein